MESMNDKMERITNIIRAKGAVDIEISTEPSMRKTNNPYLGRVRKHSAYLGVMFGESYTAEVNRRREAEGKTADFKAKKSSYETVNEFFVRKGDQLYLQFMPSMEKDHNPKAIYEVDGRPATEEEVKEIVGFFYSKGDAAKSQGLERGNEVAFRITKIENIIALGGETWAAEV